MIFNINFKKKNIEISDRLMVHAYKYKRWLYRVWEYPQVIYSSNELIILNLQNARVITSEEESVRCFCSKIQKKSFWFFYPHKWYNFIINIDQHNRFSGYINISSPFIFEEAAIKYYDFDLDFRINYDGTWIEVDIKEYEDNIIKFNYPPELVQIIHNIEIDIIDKLNNNYFQKLMNYDYLNCLIKNK